MTEHSEILMSAHAFFILQNISDNKDISRLILLLGPTASLQDQTCGSVLCLYFITRSPTSFKSRGLSEKTSESSAAPCEECGREGGVGGAW